MDHPAYSTLQPVAPQPAADRPRGTGDTDPHADQGILDLADQFKATLSQLGVAILSAAALDWEFKAKCPPVPAILKIRQEDDELGIPCHDDEGDKKSCYNTDDVELLRIFPRVRKQATYRNAITREDVDEDTPVDVGLETIERWVPCPEAQERADQIVRAWAGWKFDIAVVLDDLEWPAHLQSIMSIHGELQGIVDRIVNTKHRTIRGLKLKGAVQWAFDRSTLVEAVSKFGHEKAEHWAKEVGTAFLSPDLGSIVAKYHTFSTCWRALEILIGWERDAALHFRPDRPREIFLSGLDRFDGTPANERFDILTGDKSLSWMDADGWRKKLGRVVSAKRFPSSYKVPQRELDRINAAIEAAETWERAKGEFRGSPLSAISTVFDDHRYDALWASLEHKAANFAELRLKLSVIKDVKDDELDETIGSLLIDDLSRLLETPSPIVALSDRWFEVIEETAAAIKASDGSDDAADRLADEETAQWQKIADGIMAHPVRTTQEAASIAKIFAHHMQRNEYMDDYVPLLVHLAAAE
ncbi:MAG: hypothetical protein AB7F74_24760 [Parvibaculaceae bacterium]